jgi:hypothetical protein
LQQASFGYTLRLLKRMSSKQRYKKPPIFERVLAAYTAPMKPEVFEAKMPEWVSKIRDEYPLARPKSEWLLNIKEVNGVPTLEDGMPTANIIHVFWKPHPKKLQVHGMRLRSDRLVFHLLREDDEAHEFNDVYPAMEKWITRWMDHFEITSLRGVGLEYYNRLNAILTPQFALPNGAVAVGSALNMFANIPGRYKTMAPPYDCKVRLVVDDQKPCNFDVHVRSEDKGADGVRVEFMVRTLEQNRSIGAKQALQELLELHDIMLEEFDCFFTEQAKKSFIPYATTDSAKA